MIVQQSDKLPHKIIPYIESRKIVNVLSSVRSSSQNSNDNFGGRSAAAGAVGRGCQLVYWLLIGCSVARDQLVTCLWLAHCGVQCAGGTSVVRRCVGGLWLTVGPSVGKCCCVIAPVTRCLLLLLSVSAAVEFFQSGGEEILTFISPAISVKQLGVTASWWSGKFEFLPVAVRGASPRQFESRRAPGFSVELSNRIHLVQRTQC